MSKNKKKICQKCCKEVKISQAFCSCGSDKFAPSFVKRLDKVNKNFFVQITDSYDGKSNRLTLYKWWQGGTSSFHINTSEQWEKVKNIIEGNLAPFLKWKSKEEILKIVKKNQKDEKKASKDIKELTSSYPDFVRHILKEIDYTKLKEENFQSFTDVMTDLMDILIKADEDFRFSFLKLIKELPKQTIRAIEDLEELLKTWSLKQVTAVSYQVKERLETLELFKNRVLDDKTYEIIGDNSIHRILERAMWIIDERYWLLHSNETIRKIVGDSILKNNKNKKAIRPDFVCGTIGDKLIIVELKRPSHPLTVDDLNQLEMYLSIIEDHLTYSKFEAYLLGKKISPELSKRKKYRGSQFKIKTYTDLISDTETRYKEFIQTLRSNK